MLEDLPVSNGPRRTCVTPSLWAADEWSSLATTTSTGWTESIFTYSLRWGFRSRGIGTTLR